MNDIDRLEARITALIRLLGYDDDYVCSTCDGKGVVKRRNCDCGCGGYDDHKCEACEGRGWIFVKY